MNVGTYVVRFMFRPEKADRQAFYASDIVEPCST
jgi:hypothetical protein